MAAAVAIKKPAPSGSSALQAGKGPQQQSQQQKIGLAQQIDVVHQNDDGKGGEDQDQRVTPCAGLLDEVHRKHDRGQPGGRIHEHQSQQRTRQPKHADPGEHGRGRGRIHEGKKPTALGPGVDIKPLPDCRAHLVPEAVILGRETEHEIGDRERREDQHRHTQHDPPGALDPLPPGRLPIRSWAASSAFTLVFAMPSAIGFHSIF